MSKARITKEDAYILTDNLATKAKQKLSKILDKNRKIIEEMIKEDTPKEILEIHKNFPKYIQTSSSLYGRINGEYINVSLSVPLPAKFGTHKVEEKHLKYGLLVKKAREEYKKFYDELLAAILTLKSYKNITLKFPEAEKYLPKENTNYALTADYSKLNEQI